MLRQRHISKKRLDPRQCILHHHERDSFLGSRKPKSGILSAYRVETKESLFVNCEDPPNRQERRNFKTRKLGAANEFAAVQGIARILTRRGKFDEALAAINLAVVEDLKGYWRHSMLLTLGDTLAAATVPVLKQLAYQDDSRLCLASREIKIPLRRVTEKQLAEAKKLLAEAELDKAMLKDVLSKKW